MTIGLAGMLLGVFVVPALLLWGGHRMRRRPARWQRAFWGGLVGHLIAMIAGSVAGMIPPEEWGPNDVWRGAFAFWSFLALPAIGAILGWAIPQRRGGTTAAATPAQTRGTR